MQHDPLNMQAREDRRMLSSAITNGWNLTPEQIARYAKALDVALGIALRKNDQRAVVSCVRTMATIVGQVQADQHLEAKLNTGNQVEGELIVRVVRDGKKGSE